MPKAKNIAPSRSGYESVSIRAIDNGYLICRSNNSGYSETYSETKPKIEVPGSPKPAAKAKGESSGASALKRAAGAKRR